jgi:hypothetical protein
MSRDKKPKKGKYTDPKTGEFRHTDGDRRHRRGASAKEAVKNKRRMQELSGAGPSAEGADDDEYQDEFDDLDDETNEGDANA